MRSLALVLLLVMVGGGLVASVKAATLGYTITSYSQVDVTVRYEDAAYPGDTVSFVLFLSSKDSSNVRLRELNMTLEHLRTDKSGWTFAQVWTDQTAPANGTGPLQLISQSIILPNDLESSYLRTTVKVTYQVAGTTETAFFYSTHINSNYKLLYDQLQQAYDSLGQSYANLQIQYDQLQRQFDTLQDFLTFVQNEVAVTRSLMLLFMATTMAFLGTTLGTLVFFIYQQRHKRSHGPETTGPKETGSPAK